MTQWWREEQEQDVERKTEKPKAWYEIWAMDFYRIPSPQEWIDELNGAFKLNAQPDELLYTVRSMVLNRDTHARPTLRDLHLAVKRRRAEWHERQRQASRHATDAERGMCPMCLNIGYLTFSVTDTGDVAIPTPTCWPLPRDSSPCACQAGDSEQKRNWQAYQHLPSDLRQRVIEKHRILAAKEQALINAEKAAKAAKR